MRLATKGQIKNGSMSMNLLSNGLRTIYELWVPLERLRQQSEIVIEQLKVGRNLLRASHRRQVLHHDSAGFPGNRILRLAIEIGLDHDHLHMVPLHHVVLLKGMDRGRKNARPRLHEADHVKTEMFSKVRQ